MKLFVWLILIVLVILAIRKKSKPLSTSGGDGEGASARSFQEPATESMVCCAHCQLYLPASEAVVRAGQSYCSTAHADLH
ncbi:PP0621 family protein [Undibacterium sp. SXout20W]|uniref:PP0621 family protein n=1 Tax=Undibacterium sp. SXout20W TaxID=3413051 RepID=UPI003BF0D461